MYKKLWNELYASICSMNFFSDNGIKLTSLSGFKVNGNIVTDELIYKVQKCEEVTFQFVKDDGYSLGRMIRMPFTEFSERVNRVAEYEGEGYAIIDFEDLDIADIPSLKLDTDQACCIGQEIIVIGHHSDQENVSLRKGIVSSFFKTSKDKKLIQFDSFIKQGNSGSPLINVNTGKVIGVVGYRLSPITKTYETFKNIIEENLLLLKKSEGKMNILDIDPIQVLIANQNQLKQMNKEFYRLASMSYGYAHPVQGLEKYIEQVLNLRKSRQNSKKNLNA